MERWKGVGRVFLELNAQRTSVLTNVKFNTGYSIKLMSCLNGCFTNDSISHSYPAEHNFGWVDEISFLPLYIHMMGKHFSDVADLPGRNLSELLKASLPFTINEQDSGRSLMPMGGVICVVNYNKGSSFKFLIMQNILDCWGYMTAQQRKLDELLRITKGRELKW